MALGLPGKGPEMPRASTFQRSIFSTLNIAPLWQARTCGIKDLPDFVLVMWWGYQTRCSLYLFVLQHSWTSLNKDTAIYTGFSALLKQYTYLQWFVKHARWTYRTSRRFLPLNQFQFSKVRRKWTCFNNIFPPLRPTQDMAQCQNVSKMEVKRTVFLSHISHLCFARLAWLMGKSPILFGTGFGNIF